MNGYLSDEAMPDTRNKEKYNPHEPSDWHRMPPSAVYQQSPMPSPSNYTRLPPPTNTYPNYPSPSPSYNNRFSSPPQAPSYTVPFAGHKRRPNYSQSHSNMRKIAPVARTNVYISGFPTSWGRSQLRDLFSTFGPITQVNIITKDNGQPNRGVAFLHFEKSVDAQSAIDGAMDKVPSECKTDFTIRYANYSQKTAPDFLKTIRVNLNKFSSIGWSLESAVNIYVSQLLPTADEKLVHRLFDKFGIIKSMKVLPGKEGKGAVAFVHFENPECANKAVATMDQFSIEEFEKPISVRFANIPKEKYPTWFTLEQLQFMQTTQNIYVCQIPLKWMEADLRRVFSEFGELVHVKLLSKRDENGGVGFVHFENAISACKAVAKMNGMLPEKDANREISVQFARMDVSTFQKLMQRNYAQMAPPMGAMPMAPSMGARGPSYSNPSPANYEMYNSRMPTPPARSVQYNPYNNKNVGASSARMQAVPSYHDNVSMYNGRMPSRGSGVYKSPGPAGPMALRR